MSASLASRNRRAREPRSRSGPLSRRSSTRTVQPSSGRAVCEVGFDGSGRPEAPGPAPIRKQPTTSGLRIMEGPGSGIGTWPARDGPGGQSVHLEELAVGRDLQVADLALPGLAAELVDVLAALRLPVRGLEVDAGEPLRSGLHQRGGDLRQGDR